MYFHIKLPIVFYCSFSILIAGGDTELKIFSVKLSPHHNRVFLVQTGDNFVCHSEKCKENWAVHIASNVPFTCDHTDAVQSFSYPTFTKNLKEDILAYNCDNATHSILRGDLHLQTDFSHVACISEGCYAVFSGASKGPSNPIYIAIYKRKLVDIGLVVTKVAAKQVA